MVENLLLTTNLTVNWLLIVFKNYDTVAKIDQTLDEGLTVLREYITIN